MDGDQQQLRNLRDFLLVYNRMTEICFGRCASNLNYRTVTMDEERCLDSCASKLIRSNHRLMSAYVGLMPGIVQRRINDYESKAAELNQSSSPESTPEALAAGEGAAVQMVPTGESMPSIPSTTADSNS
ncbi:mitochondrial import inner membrane translocase subunit Tim10 B [Ambystoma mexicanum]|uniref:mitochondrial import inner membrane translocase subunit Tim10 B n=1 Tax=Ambystoma mexicanum TaxID=8296 RepID=UPI0037E8AA76